MTTIKTKILILFAFIVILPGCSNDKSDTKVKRNSVEEVSKTPSKKKKDQTKKKMTLIGCLYWLAYSHYYQTLQD